MLICFICQTQHHSSQQLISHLRGEHSYYPGSKHLNNVHSNVQRIAQTSTVGCSSEPVASSSRIDALSLEDQMNPQHESPCSSVSSENNDSELTKDLTKEMCESIVAKLQVEF